MTTIKRKLRKTNKPLQQLAKRYAEEQAFKEMNVHQPDRVLKRSHFEGPLINDGMKIRKQYKIIKNESFSIDCTSTRNNCVLMKDGSIATILNIIKSEEGSVYLIGKDIFVRGPFFTANQAITMSKIYQNLQMNIIHGLYLN